jgi:hypothetical protein
MSAICLNSFQDSCKELVYCGSILEEISTIFGAKRHRHARIDAYCQEINVETKQHKLNTMRVLDKKRKMREIEQFLISTGDNM